MAHIALIGATGNVGSRILTELSSRGHEITAISRHPENIRPLPGVTAVKGDIQGSIDLVALLAGHETIVSSVKFLDTDFERLINAVRGSGVKRFLVVGGAGSLEIAPGHRLVDQPDFPEEYKEEALRGADFLGMLKTIDDLDWTFLSPSALFVPGGRTRNFRLGKDQLLTTDKGSSISFEDYAIAMVDEIERPKHSRERFTVGY